MAIPETLRSEEQRNQDYQAQQEAEVNLLDKIQGNKTFQSLELPSPEAEVSEQEVEQEGQETSEEGDEVSEETQDLETEESQEPDEDLIPKSKIQPRIDKLTSEIKELRAKLEEKENISKPKDDVSKKLEQMSEAELRDLRRNVRVAQAKNASNDEQLQQLVDLEDKIDVVLREAPTRFANAQLNAFKQAEQRIVQELQEDNIEVAKVGPQIIEKAKEIYSLYPKLQKDIDGQAIALELAAKHIKEVTKLTAKTTSNVNLKQQVNTLKKKTALDTKSTKAVVDVNKEQIMRKKALNGTYRDKLDFIKSSSAFNIDAMIPEEYKNR